MSKQRQRGTAFETLILEAFREYFPDAHRLGLQGIKDCGDLWLPKSAGYVVEAKNRKGDVELSLPPNARASITGNTRNGDVVSDFPLSISGDESKSVSGTIGAGGPKVVLEAENGDIHIKRGDEAPPAPPAVSATPAAPNAPHLKAPKVPAAPVAQ